MQLHKVQPKLTILGKKVGMITYPSETTLMPATVLEVHGLSVWKIGNLNEKAQLQEHHLGFFAGTRRAFTKSYLGKFAKVESPSFLYERSAWLAPNALTKQHYSNEDLFKVGQLVGVRADIKGRGFTGGIKRHNFSGLNRTHGVSVAHRSIGSIGTRRKPTKVLKGKKMPGRWAGKVTIANLLVLDVLANGIIVKGATPGHKTTLCNIIINSYPLSQ